ncbi:MAG: hypothetical protein GXP31_12520 [Kiritimatiellaeota bacterium]|nr:hypothetical protein [Kiritimatiellota bacterium]
MKHCGTPEAEKALKLRMSGTAGGLRLAACMVVVMLVAPAGKAENSVIRKPPDTGFVTLRSLSYSEAREIVAPFLSEKGRLGFAQSRNLLIIHDYPENIEAVRRILKKVDTAPVNIRIDVAFDQSRRNSSADADVRIGGVTVRRRGGRTRIGAAGVLSAGAEERRSRTLTRQFVLTLNGHAARIWVGKEVADPVWVREYGYRHGWWRQELAKRRLGASLEVRPRVLPDGNIEIQVYPRLSARGPEPLSVDVKELTTTVVVRDGQTVRLGGLDQRKRDVYTRLFGIGRVFDGNRLTITLTPHLVRTKRPVPATKN